MVDMTTYAPPSDSMAVFCDAVRRRLRLLRISQGELARRAEMDPSQLSRMLKGTLGNCTFAMADRVAAGLGTTTTELLSGKD